MKYSINIVHDMYPESPREIGNFGVMCLSHKRYCLPNETGIKVSDYDDVPGLLAAIQKRYGKIVYKIVYGYDHSGLCVSTTPYSCLFDSGVLGIIFVPVDKLLKEFGRKKLSKKLREHVESILTAEVAVYDSYLQGEVYGFQIVDEDGDEVTSCYGFYGYNHDQSGLNQAVNKALSYWTIGGKSNE